MAGTSVTVATLPGATERPIIEFKPGDPASIADRWECAMVWAYIQRFTELKGQIEGLDNITDLERAVVDSDPIILHPILAKFIDYLRPKRNTSLKQISSTLYTLIAEMCAGSERCVWWSYQRQRNIIPFGSDMDFFALPWEQKLTILRQLVEWQLGHNAYVRDLLDRAHGLVRGGHRKRADDAPRPTLVPPDPEHTRDKLQFIPLGSDHSRKRYWIVDDSPRIYISGNPWKSSCVFQTVSTTREEFVEVIQALQASRPPVRPGKKRGKLEAQHDEVIEKLEEQLVKVDAELHRLSLLDKKNKERRQREREAAQNELRDTRTRIKVNKVDYVYGMQPDQHEEGVIYDDGEEIDELDDDEYMDDPLPIPGESGAQSKRGSSLGEDEEFIQDEDEDEAPSGSRARKGKAPKKEAASDSGRRRSGRASLKRSYAEPEPPRGERRSTRRSTIGSARNEVDQGDDLDSRPAKRSRMSSVGSSLTDTGASGPAQASAGIANMTIDANSNGAVGPKGPSAIKPTEKVVDVVPGKKKSKFWFYAVEDVPPPENGSDLQTNGIDLSSGRSRRASTKRASLAASASAVSTPPTNGRASSRALNGHASMPPPSGPISLPPPPNGDASVPPPNGTTVDVEMKPAGESTPTKNSLPPAEAPNGNNAVAEIAPNGHDVAPNGNDVAPNDVDPAPNGTSYENGTSHENGTVHENGTLPLETVAQ